MKAPPGRAAISRSEATAVSAPVVNVVRAASSNALAAPPTLAETLTGPTLSDSSASLASKSEAAS